MQAQNISIDAHYTIDETGRSASAETVKDTYGIGVRAYPRTDRPNLMVSGLTEN